MSSNPLVTILVPVYNEVENIDRLVSALTSEVIKPTQDLYNFEILFTDNHSTDGTFEKIRALSIANPMIKAARFSRNFGFQRSIFSGYCLAKGDAIVQVDCDLQDPPELIVQFLEKWKQGFKVVYGVRIERQENFLINFARAAFYWLIDKLSEDTLPAGAGDFRLVDKVVADYLRGIYDSSPYLRGLIASVGYEQIGIPYKRQSREFGRSKFNLFSYLQLALDGIANHSLAPLRFSGYFGTAVSFVTVIVSFIFIFGKFVLGQNWPAGFATTTILILFSISLNALFLGIIGIYLGRIYLQVKAKPVSVIEQTINLSAPPRIYNHDKL